MKKKSSNLTSKLKSKHRGIKISSHFLHKNVYPQVEHLVQSCVHIFAQSNKSRKNIKIFNKGIDGKATEMDVLIEKYLLSNLTQIFPQASFISEEKVFFDGALVSEHKATTDYTWLIDPIDGTNNYINGLDYFVVSVALVFRGQTIAGWILNPMRGFFYVAYIGKGARLYEVAVEKNKLIWNYTKNLKSSYRAKILSDAVLATTNVHAHDNAKLEVFDLYKKITLLGRSTRKMGSAAQDLCYCAEGILDGFWQKGLSPWDTAAAYLICSESGLIVTDYQGHPYDPWKESILVAPKKLHQQLLSVIINHETEKKTLK